MPTQEPFVFGAATVTIDKDGELVKIVSAINKMDGEAERILDNAVRASSVKLAKAAKEVVGQRYIWHDSSAKSEDLNAIKPYRGRGGGIKAAGKRRNMTAREITPRVRSVPGSRPDVYSGRSLSAGRSHAFTGDGNKSKGFLVHIRGNPVFVSRIGKGRGIAKNNPRVISRAGNRRLVEEVNKLTAIQSLSIADMIKSREAMDEAAERADFTTVLQDEIHKRVQKALKR